MAKIDNLLLKSKFRGCLLGALLGDCLGAPFEGEVMTAGGKMVLQNYFDKLDGPYFNTPAKKYTDDTAMLKSVAKCLIDKPAVDYKFMARLFVKEYYRDPKRGYGRNVVDVFSKLRNTKFVDINKPAREQFMGMGSLGNGGAMRIAPIALYFYNNYKGMVECARRSTEITHTHHSGVNGAILQSIAIQQSLLLESIDKVDPDQFVEQLIFKMKDFELEDAGDDDDTDEDPTPYKTKLTELHRLLTSENADLSDKNIIKTLGNNITAIDSVVTAIFCFLRAQSDVPDIKTDNIFRRTIQYAISLGGDTDTIATMAGGIAGAFLGEEYINEALIRHCEFNKEMLEIADNLYNVVVTDVEEESTN